MRNLIGIFAVLAVLVFAQGCSTDVDVNAPYEERTVVFGILDLNAEKQVIKINKTFLGSGNNLDYALIRDSSEYADNAITAVVQEFIGVNLAAEYPLTPEIVENKEKEEGDIFYAPEQKVYTFTTTPDEDGLYLNKDATYKLLVEFASGRTAVFADTDMMEVSPTDITKPFNIPETSPNSVEINFVSNINGGVANYQEYSFKYNSAPNAKRYESFLRFTFREDVYADASQTGTPVSSEDTFIDISLQDKVTSSLQGGQNFTIPLAGEDFFRTLEQKLTVDPKIRRVIGYSHMSSMRCFDYYLLGATTDLNTYLEVNAPVTGVATDRPQYTNVSAGGIGLFSSRGTVISKNIKTSNNTLTELYNGIYTSGLNFCVDANEFTQYSGQAFACP